MKLYSDFTPPSLCVQINPQLLQGAPCSKGNLIPEYIEGQQSLGLKVKHDFVKEKAGIQIQHTCCLELLSVSSERKDCGKALDGFSSRASRADFNPNLGRNIAHSSGEQAARQRRDDDFQLRDLKKTTCTLKISLICCFYIAGGDRLWRWNHTAVSCSCSTDSGNRYDEEQPWWFYMHGCTSSGWLSSTFKWTSLWYRVCQ